MGIGNTFSAIFDIIRYPPVIAERVQKSIAWKVLVLVLSILFMHYSRMLRASYHGLGVSPSVHPSHCCIVSKRCKL